LLTGEPEHLEHVWLGDFFATKGDQLIEHRFGIAQSTFCTPGDGVRRGWLQLDFLLTGNELQVIGDKIGGNAVKVETLTTAQDCR